MPLKGKPNLVSLRRSMNPKSNPNPTPNPTPNPNPKTNPCLTKLQVPFVDKIVDCCTKLSGPKTQKIHYIYGVGCGECSFTFLHENSNG